MKKISLVLLPLIAILLVATSCKDKNAYTIKGKIDAKHNGKEVYLQKLSADGNSFVPTDTVTIENGIFEITGIAQEEPAIRFVSVASNEVSPAIVIIEAGDINVSIDSIPSVTGTPLNDQYQEFSKKSMVATKKMIALENEYNAAAAQGNGVVAPELEARIDAEYEAANAELSSLVFEFVKANAQNPIGEFVFLTAGNSLQPEQLKLLLPEFRSEFKKDARIQRLEEHFALLEKTEVGKSFINVSGQDLQGKEVSLADYVGKGNYVLVDFWASWCKPCLDEMPNLVKDYNLFKNKGFQIVGISLDVDKNKWAAKSKELGIVWPQFSDLGGWESPSAVAYGITSIPATILLDKEGKIIYRNLRGKELSNKLAELMP